CPWSGERHWVPIQAHPEGWQAAIDIVELTKDGGESRSWSLRAVTGDSDEVPLRVPLERRVRLPRSEIIGDHRVQLRLGDRAVPVLDVRPAPAHGQWGALWKVRYQVTTASAAEPAGPDSLQSTARSTVTRTVDLHTLQDIVTAPQVARST